MLQSARLFFYSRGFLMLTMATVAMAQPTVQSSAGLPPVAARTLSGRAIVLPAPHRLTLIVNTSSAKARAALWASASDLCARHAVLDCYQAVAVPRFNLLHPSLDAQRREVPDEARDRFALVTTNLAVWRKLLGRPGPGDYAFLLGPDGSILWQNHTGRPDALTNELNTTLLEQNF